MKVYLPTAVADPILTGMVLALKNVRLLFSNKNLPYVSWGSHGLQSSLCLVDIIPSKACRPYMKCVDTQMKFESQNTIPKHYDYDSIEAIQETDGVAKFENGVLNIVGRSEGPTREPVEALAELRVALTKTSCSSTSDRNNHCDKSLWHNRLPLEDPPTTLRRLHISMRLNRASGPYRCENY